MSNTTSINLPICSNKIYVARNGILTIKIMQNTGFLKNTHPFKAIYNDNQRCVITAHGKVFTNDNDDYDLVAEMTDQITLSWQQINTAPRDGRDILAYIPSHIIKLKTERNVGWVKICRFVPDEWTDGKWVDGSGFTQPTHWMPLPDAPEE